MIKFINVYKKSKERKFYILRGVDFEIEDGELIYLIGGRGAGKTTILNSILGRCKSDSGKVLLDGHNVLEIGDKKMSILRKKIGFVDHENLFFEKRTVLKNLSYPLEILNEKPHVIHNMVEEWLKFIGLYEKRNYLLKNLSDGEKRNLALARAVIIKPKLLLIDDFLVDGSNRVINDMIKIFKNINQNGTTIIFALKNSKIPKELPGRIIEIEKGEIINAN